MATAVDEVEVKQPIVTNHAHRISWGAVIAGVIIAIIVQVMMNVLGLAIGASLFDPTEVTNPIGPTFSTGAVIWIAATTLLSLFAGGYVASHLAGIPDETDGVLHGLLTWAVATIVAFILLSMTTSSIVSGVNTLVVEGLGLVGASVETVAPEVADALDVRDSVISSIEEEAGSIDTDASTNAQLVIAIGNLLQAEVDTEEATETRQVAIDLLTEETDLSQAEAETLIDDWEQRARQAVQDADTIAQDATANLTDAIAATSGILFLTLVVGAFAGGAGGFVGRPD